MKHQKVKYKLVNNDLNTFIWLSDTLLIGSNDNPAPKNWEEAEQTLKRSEKTYGVYTELSKNLEFTKKGAIFLRNAYNHKDIEANVTLYEYRFNPTTDAPYLHSTGVFDFSEYKEDKLTVKIPFKSGGLNALIKSQLREKFELERTESINGKVLADVDKVTVALQSRDILLISELEVTELNQFGASNSTPYRSPIMEIVSQSDTRVTSVFDDFVPYTTGTQWENVNLGVANYMYLNNDVTKTLNFKGSFEVTANAGTNFIVDAAFIITNAVGAYQRHYVVYNEATLTPRSWRTIPIDQNITLEPEENIAFVLTVGSSFSSDYTLMYRNSSITITEDSQRDDSQTQAVLIHEAGDKLMQIITGEQGRFYSEYYGRTDLGYDADGLYSRTAFTTGFWIRQFYEKPIEMSLDNYINTSNSIHNTGYTIETKNGVETLVVEDMKYFFQDAVAIVLPNQVTGLEREAASEFCDSSLTFGYKEGGDYEEAMGLDEYNVRTSFVTNITRTDTKYEKISDARADSYAKEFARRKPKLTFPEEDTRYDKDLHLLDLKTGSGTALEERVWQDDYEVEPTGVYSPDTATNLRLTPFRNSERHQWFYGAGLFKHQDEKVRYSSSDGSKTLVTKKTGEVERPENGDVLVSELERPRFVNQWITFEHPVDYEINTQIYGKTEVNGRLIPNYFFKVQFLNEYNKKETGYLFELKPNKSGNWKLLKAL